jgi:hypothetical protein
MLSVPIVQEVTVVSAKVDITAMDTVAMMSMNALMVVIIVTQMPVVLIH